jgi:P-type Mg2+ transporter
VSGHTSWIASSNVSPVGLYPEFSKQPALYWPLLAVTLLCYVLLTQGVKMWLVRRKWI